MPRPEAELVDRSEASPHQDAPSPRARIVREGVDADQQERMSLDVEGQGVAEALEKVTAPHCACRTTRGLRARRRGRGGWA